LFQNKLKKKINQSNENNNSLKDDANFENLEQNIAGISSEEVIKGS
jgi:hypothetical protein